VIKHYSMDSCTGEWLREQVAMETEETVVLPAITFKRMPELDMSEEEVLKALEVEFNERAA
jgi:hypothetical protein